jgi:hypothetical protein
MVSKITKVSHGNHDKTNDKSGQRVI